MKKYTTLLLGSAAAMLIATSGAQAADPIFDVVDPREPVYRCDITGFIELPGTDICWKIGGFAKSVTWVTDEWGDGLVHQTAKMIRPRHDTEITFADEVLVLNDPTTTGTAFWDLESVPGEVFYNPRPDQFRMAAFGRLNFDARTATEYGTVRAFIEMQAAGTGGTSFNLRHAFVQFGNWTFGQTWSTFYGPGIASTSFAFTNLNDSSFRLPQIRYTQPFGNGFSASIAIESPVSTRTASPALFQTDALVWDDDDLDGETLAGFPLVDADIVGDRTRVPNFVGAIGYSGAWGSAQLAGVLVRNDVRWEVVQGDDIEVVTHQGARKWGWGVNFGASINLMEGTTLGFQTTYTDGASQYHGAIASRSLIWRDLDDDLFSLGTVTAWSVGANIRHAFSPTMAFSFGGAWGQADYGQTGFVAWIEDDGDWLLVPGTIKNKAWEVFANINWTPVANTSFLLEARYGRHNPGFDLHIPAEAIGWDGDDSRIFRHGGTRDAWAVALDVTRSF